MSGPLGQAVAGAVTTFDGLAKAGAITSNMLTSAFGGMVGKVGGLIGGLTTKVGGFFKSMVTGASTLSSLFIGPMLIGVGGSLIKIAANAEQARVAFETLLKSPEQAGAFMTWIEDISIKTPLMRREIEAAAKTFLAYGMDVNTAKRATWLAVEATSALGLENDKLARISVNLAQIYNSQKVREMELKELRLAGFAVNKIFIDAIADGTLKVKGQGDAMSVTAGASKKLTAQYLKANETLPELSKGLESAIRRVQELKDKHKEGSATFSSAEKSVLSYQRRINEVNDTVSKFTTAQAGAGKVIKQTAEEQEKLTEETAKWIKENYTGAEIFDILEKGGLKLYGGASIRQVTTFAGAISNFGDVFDKVVKRAFGISAAGEIQIGGAFDKIRNAAARLIEFLIDNVDQIGKFFNEFLSRKETMVGIASFFVGVLTPALLGIVAPLLLVGAKWVLLGLIIDKAAEKFGGWNVVLEKARDLWEKLRPILEDMKDNVIKKLEKAWEGLVKVFDFLKPSLIELGDSLWQLVINIKDFIVAAKPIETFLGAILIGAIWLAINTLNILADAFRGIVRAVTNVINWFKQLSESWRLLIAGISGSLITIAAIGIAFNILATATIAMLVGKIQTLILFVWYAKDAIFAFAAVLTTTPWGAAILAASLLAGGLFALTTQTDILKDRTVELADAHARVLDEQRKLADFKSAAEDAHLRLRGVMINERDTARELGDATDAYNEFVKTHTENTPEAVAAFFRMEKAALNHDIAVKGVKDSTKAVNEADAKVVEQEPAVTKALENVGKAADEAAKSGWQKLADKIGEVVKNLAEFITKHSNATKIGIGLPGFNLWGGQHGGIVPGPVGQAVPIMAHGGERITPRGSNANAPFANQGLGGGVTINMSGNFNMDSEARVKELADRIIRILGRQSELSRYGVGF